MKPEELLNSLDHVGEDLLAEAEQNVLVRTKRPWLKTAVAAVLVVAAGVGGLLTLKHFTMRSSTQPTLPAVSTLEELPKLTVGSCWRTLPGQLSYPFGSGPSLCDPAITHLPVYKSELKLTADDISFYYSKDQLTTMLEDSISRLGVARTGEIEYSEKNGTVYSASAETTLGTVTAYGHGCFGINFNHHYEFDESGEDLVPLTGSKFTDAAQTLLARDRALLGLSESDYVLYDAENWCFRIFPAVDDPTKQLLVRSFGSVEQLYSDSGYGDILLCNQRPGSENWYDAGQDYLIEVGDYPIISLEEAQALVLQGSYYCLYSLPSERSLTEDLLSDAALVYSTDYSKKYSMPFYRFLIDDYILSVPAVRSEYLSDYPDNMVTDPYETEPVESTDHTENESLRLTRLGDGRCVIQGPAGSVEALEYMGIREQIEKYADVDGDGENELLYLFNGPTSGLYTKGIAVYGLDGGMPVLRAATILSLDYYDPSLRSDEAGNILLVLDPRFPAPEGTESVWFILSVKDGSIQFNGTLPAGCQIWDVPSDTGSEQELAAIESQLTKGYFTKLSLHGRDYFSNSSTRIWQDGDKILRKDLSTEETETLFTLEHDEEIETVLIGVSENRLYFGWNEAEDWWGENVYSVNFRNGDRTEIGNALEYSFANGLLVLEDFRTDVRPVTLQVIDSRDRKVVQYNVCWCSTFVDGSLYFVYMPELQECGKLEGIPAELRDRDVTLSYAVCRVDPDGSVTELGAIQRNYPNGWNKESAWINPETHTIFFDYTGICYDLFTLALKTDELPEDLHELVEDSISVQGAYTDACDNLCDYSYTLPRLKLDNEEAQAINAEIDEKYGAYVRQVQSRKDGDISLEYPKISYETAVWNDVVTIVISQDYNYDYVNYDVYCYDCTAKCRLDTPALLEKLGISQERFLDACRTTFRERYEKNTAAMPEEERAQYEKEFPEMLPESEKFVNLELQAYPGEDGTLMTVAGITTWVGAACYYHLIPVLGIQN